MTPIEFSQIRALNSQELDTRLLGLVRSERKLTVMVLHHLREVDRRMLWAELGFSSLFRYCAEHLGYSESQAARRISAMRLLKEIPELEPKIADGSLNLTVLNQAQLFFNQEKKENGELKKEEKQAVLARLDKKTQKQAERELAQLRPQAAKPDKERVLNKEQVEIRFTASPELAQLLKRARELFGNLSYDELLTKILGEHLKKADPVQQLQRSASPKRESVPGKRRSISVNTKRAVWHRDGAQCAYLDRGTGKRCECRVRLQLDHVVPVACGGEDTVENLRLLCPSHNKLAALKVFGAGKMSAYLPGLT